MKMKWITIFAFAVTAASAQEYTFTTNGGFSAGAKMFEFEGKVVTGAPYSGQAVTETTQVLADGNRITRKTSSVIARDSQGRTRREQHLNSLGPWNSPENNDGVVFINDPVAGTRYTLETNSKMAVKASANPRSMQERQEMEVKLKAARSKEEAEHAGTRVKLNEPQNTAKTESLGTKIIEGVQAEGKRVTETIPAGKIGNEKPIDVVNETWYSADLQIVVMSKHSDPRGGDVVYTLTNISRAEPDPSMFMVPQDYKVREEPARLENRR